MYGLWLRSLELNYAYNYYNSQQQNPGGGQGSDEGITKVTKYSTTNDKAIGVQNTIRILKAALHEDSDCAGFLKITDDDIDRLVGDIPGVSSTVGVGSFSDNSINAQTGIVGTDLPAGAVITVNTDGAYFSSNRKTGYMGNIGGGTDLAKAFILLHELGHVSDILASPDDVPLHSDYQNYNNLNIQQNCATTLNLFGGKF
jgi:hypothetical protein